MSDDVAFQTVAPRAQRRPASPYVKAASVGIVAGLLTLASFFVLYVFVIFAAIFTAIVVGFLCARLAPHRPYYFGFIGNVYSTAALCLPITFVSLLTQGVPEAIRSVGAVTEWVAFMAAIFMSFGLVGLLGSFCAAQLQKKRLRIFIGDGS